MTVIDITSLNNPSNMFVKPQPTVHDQKVTIHHWQLRDLLMTDAKNDLVFPTGENVFKYNYKTEQRTPLVHDLGYAPTCMATGYGYWAAGGQKGEVTLKDIKSDNQARIASSNNSMINNGLSFSQWNGQTRLLVANNDQHVRVYSVPDLRLIGTLYFNGAVNSTSVSPDGQKMIVVGDDNKISLFRVTNSGDYDNVSTYEVSKDANFSVAWNHSSEKFAVTSQDGSVHIWDIRNRNPLAKFASVQPGTTKGAARCVKFTQTGAVDLLAFTEHVSHVHVVDARTFNEQQTIRVATTGQDVPITGLTFSNDSKKMFVGLESAILDFDVDTSSRRRFAYGSLV